MLRTTAKSLRGLIRLASTTALMGACDFDSSGYGPQHTSVAESSSDDGADDAGAEHAADDGPLDPGDDGRGDDDRGDEVGEGSEPSDSSGPQVDVGTTGDAATDDGVPTDDSQGEVTGVATEGEAEGGDEDPKAACPHDVLTLLWAADAEVGAPMSLVATDANLDPEVAASVVAESGTVTFSIELACAGQYSLWGLVWDYAPGGYATDDPDSYYVGVGGSEQTWRYGCQTAEVESGLSWQPINALLAQPCDTEPMVLDVAAPGTIELSFRNREAGGGSAVAGIAAIVVSNDPSADPSTLYEPY